MEVLVNNLNTKLSDADGNIKRLSVKHMTLNNIVRDTSGDSLSIEELRDLSKWSRLELVYFVKVANHTKNAEVICQLLKSQDSMVVSYALQAKWFFRGTTHQHMVNVEYFDKEIFPFVSYHTICRIISTLSSCLEDSTTAEHFYDYIHQWYGFTQAVKLLPKCSIDFIRSQIMNTLVDVPCAQMYYIYKKDRALALEYLEYSVSKEKAEKLPKNYSSKMNYNKIWEQLGENDPKEFLRIMEKYPSVIKFHLSRKVTENILKIGKDKIIENPLKYSDIFSVKLITNFLKGNDLEKYLLKSLPSKENDLSYYYNYFLHLKPVFRLKMLMKLHPLKYNGSDFLERKDFLHWELVEHLSKEERIKWAKKKYENVKPGSEGGGEQYLRYMDQAEAIPRIQSLCAATTECDKRSKYLEYAVECCKINNDVDGLFKVMKYVSQRHRNDNPSLRQSYLTRVSECFTLHELSAECWEIINEMINFLCIEKEIEKNYWQYQLIRILKEYLHYCLKNGLDINMTIDKIIQYDGGFLEIAWDMKNKDYENIVTNAFIEKYKTKLLNNNLRNEEIDVMLTKIIETMDDKKIPFDEQPWLADYIKKVYEKFVIDNNLLSIFQKLHKDPKMRGMFLNETFQYLNTVRFVNNFIQHHPDIVVNNMKSFIKNMVVHSEETRRVAEKKVISKKYRMYEKIAIYFKDSLGQEIIKALREHMSQEDVKDSQQSAVDALYLCYLLPPQEREDLIKQFHPTTLKVDLINNHREYENGQIISKFIKLLNPPVEMNTLMPFVGGDYLKYSLYSLLSLPFKRSRSESKVFVSDLLKNPVSVRKHAVRLAYFLFPREDTLPMYKSLWENDKNTSMREIVFSFTYKLLKTEENPEIYKHIWESLKGFMASLNENDKEIFKHLTKPHEIMPAFVKDYCETCWNTLEDLTSQNIDVNVHVLNFTKNVHSSLEILSEEFCERITIKHLDSIDYKNLDKSKEVFSLLVKFFIQAKNIEFQNKLIHSMCHILKEFIDVNWNIKVEHKYQYRNVIKNFVVECCVQSCGNKAQHPINVLEQISAMLHSSLPVNSILELHTFIRATQCYKIILSETEFVDYSPSHGDEPSPIEYKLYSRFGEKIGIYLNEMCEKYGVAIMNKFSNNMRHIFNRISPDKIRNSLELYFISGFLVGDASQSCRLMAVDWIPSEVPDNSTDIDMYNELLIKIVKDSDEIVTILLNDKIEITDYVD